jgi:DNA-binding response OmpR family regulator
MSESRGLVMVVEDERAIADVERMYLTQAGYGVHVESDGSVALSRIRQLKPIAIVLDVGLPGLDGIEVCRALRAENDWTPIIFVTARDDEVDRILGLELGADDYLTKPFSPRELVARVKSVLRRHDGPGTSALVSLGDVTVDVDARTASVAGIGVDLTTIEFDLLVKFVKNPGRVFTREQLLSSVWGQADYGGGRTVDVHVAQLRAKLGESSPIRTTRGVGYSAASALPAPAPSPEPDR